ncbi:hypothetical protein ACIQUV_01285 [Streptomyces globosus]|uniref:hypothetical protein n=1 Tax=Streptomyces globosus TaxID=68209 RepID=UPI0038039F0F
MIAADHDTALRAAHQVNDLPLCAHILRDLSFQAASRGHPADAITLGDPLAGPATPPRRPYGHPSCPGSRTRTPPPAATTTSPTPAGPPAN